MWGCGSPRASHRLTIAIIVDSVMALVTGFRFVDTCLMAVGGLECFHRRAEQRSETWSVKRDQTHSTDTRTEQACVQLQQVDAMRRHGAQCAVRRYGRRGAAGCAFSAETAALQRMNSLDVTMEVAARAVRVAFRQRTPPAAHHHHGHRGEQRWLKLEQQQAAGRASWWVGCSAPYCGAPARRNACVNCVTFKVHVGHACASACGTSMGSSASLSVRVASVPAARAPRRRRRGIRRYDTGRSDFDKFSWATDCIGAWDNCELTMTMTIHLASQIPVLYKLNVKEHQHHA